MAIGCVVEAGQTETSEGNAEAVSLLSKARFMFFRDSVSLVKQSSRALEKVAAANELVRQRQQRMTDVLQSAASNA